MTLAFTCVVGLVFAAGAWAKIVPQHSIAGVALEMTRPEVKDLKGDPDRIKHGTNDFGKFTQFIYRNSHGKLEVTFQGNQGATAVRTNRRTQKTAEGVHVGSPESALHTMPTPTSAAARKAPTSGIAGRAGCARGTA